MFINHQGPDVKKGFAIDLYHALCKHRLRVFLDTEELQEGDELTSQIEGVIRTTSIQIAILSPEYVVSSWCLNELLLVFEMLQWASTIFPVFSDVKPSYLRYGMYARSLHLMEEKKTFDYQTRQEKPRYHTYIIKKWRKSLYDAANISGFDLETYNGNRAQLVDKIVQRVLDKMEKIPLHVSPYPTGLDEKIKDLERTVLLQHQSSSARVVGIVGFGRIGKTTLAKEFFNLHRADYHRSCFLFDVREKVATGFLNKLQMKLLRELTKLNNEKIDNTREGKAMLTRCVESKTLRAAVVWELIRAGCSCLAEKAIVWKVYSALGSHHN